MTFVHISLKSHKILISPGYKVHERHSFLTRLLGVTKPEEDVSYANMIRLLIWVPVYTVLFSVGEVAMFFAYNFKVSTVLAQ